MKRIIIIVASIGIILLLTALTLDQIFPRSYHHLITSSTNLANENVDGLFVNDDFYSKKISEKYGEKTEQSRDVENYDYFKLNNGIEVAVNNKGKITRFIVTDSNLKTAKGIKIGDEKKAIVQAYGENDYFRTEQGADIIGYVDKKRNISLEFWLFDNKINMFRLDDKSMK
ncbi:DUF1131 family protein [Gottfriedia acidiceleris]|uniref:DUF1131 family protein n=1 Tax=Gottfriedia acidiceleris TaxID=371036 RepID=UPI00101D1A27|nr:DUF1131 family protein [Gottfriedia acidiceleris]